MDYVIASLTKKKEEEAYRIYVTDSLQSIAHNTALCIQRGSGMELKDRFLDILHQDEKKTDEKEDNKKKAEAAKASIRNKLKG